MITGYNTDVKCGDKVFHVQTEDKGSAHPLIESLIYVKGAILDAYRTNYEEFLGSKTFSESTLQKILEFQHRQIVTSIKRGQFHKGMILQAYSEGTFIFELTDAKKSSPSKTLHVDEKKTESAPLPDPATSAVVKMPPVSQPSTTAAHVIPSSTGEMVPPVSPPSVRPNRLELAIDASEAAEVFNDQGIEICIQRSKEFIGGTHVELELFVQSRQGRLRLENVQVMVKIIGTTFSPRLYAGKTDKNGSLRMNFNLPTYSVGSAALIVQASTALGNDEIKYLIKRK